MPLKQYFDKLRMSGCARPISRNPLVYRGWPSKPSSQENVIAQWVPASAGMTVGGLACLSVLPRKDGIHTVQIVGLPFVVSPVEPPAVDQSCLREQSFDKSDSIETLDSGRNSG